MTVPMESPITHWVSEHWLALLAFIGTIVGAVYFVYHTLKTTIPKMKEDIASIEKAIKALDGRATELGFAKKKDLFDAITGKPVFQPCEVCDDIREQCNDERQKVKQEIFAKLDEVQGQLSTNGNNMTRLLAKVETLMVKDERQERLDEMEQLATTLSEKLAESIAAKLSKK